MQALERGSSVLVAAPTGAGKTAIAEMAIDRALTRGSSAIYASPLKALSNQKFRDFRERYGAERVGILTGDVQENPAAPLLIVTTEILHNRMLCGELGPMSRASCLIFDEFHFLSDPDRGRVWEETIILCPRNTQIVCLSATLPNIAELGDWMGQQVGTVEVIVETERPVPLSYQYFAAGELHPVFTAGVPDRALQHYDVRPARGEAGPSIVTLLPLLLRQQMTPALAFMFSRRDAERQAHMAAVWAAQHAPLQSEVASRVAAAVAAIDRQELALPQAQALTGCLAQGVGFHHAGVLPELKELVEQLFGDGLLRLLCATETFAMGLNMPARTVALPRITKFDGRAHRELTAREFQQMAGRAGRRGKDEQGYVVLMADPWKPFSAVARLISAPLEPVRSAFAFSYNTLLNVGVAYGAEAAESILSHSFLVHQLERSLATAEAQCAELENGGSRKQRQDASQRAASLRASIAAGRHLKELEVMRTALAELGFVSSAPKTGLLRGIFENSGLLLAEMLDDARFSPETLTPPDFAELMSWFVADGRKPSRGAPGRLSPRLRQARQLLEDATARVQRAERKSGMLLTHPVVPVYTNLVCRCCAGEDVARLSREYQISEGDIAVQCDRTRQLLRQVARVTQDLAGYAGLASLAGGALQCLAPGRSSDGEEEFPT